MIKLPMKTETFTLTPLQAQRIRELVAHRQDALLCFLHDAKTQGRDDNHIASLRQDLKMWQRIALAIRQQKKLEETTLFEDARL